MMVNENQKPVEVLTPPLRHFTREAPVAADELQGGHVPFGVYLAHLSRTLYAWFAELGVGPGRPIPGGPVVAHVELDYRGETFSATTLRCVFSVLRVGRSSLEHRVEIFDVREPEAVKAVGRTVSVWRGAGGETAAWPAAVLEKCWPAERETPAQV